MLWRLMQIPDYKKTTPDGMPVVNIILLAGEGSSGWRIRIHNSTPENFLIRIRQKKQFVPDHKIYILEPLCKTPFLLSNN